MKKAVCISIFNHYDNRVLFAEEFFASKGYEVTYIASDFDHYTKKKRLIERPNVVHVKGRPYTRNISPARLYSHYRSANECYKVLEQLHPDLIYTLVPPNSQSRIAAKYKRRHKSTVLLLDLFDLWPETFPALNSNPLLRVCFRGWKRVRDCGFSSADYIITECGLYRKVLEHCLADKRSKILHLCKRDFGRHFVGKMQTTPLNICYLGAINNIINIEAIGALLRETAKYKQIVLHIIGGGENTKLLLDFAAEENIRTEYYGLVFDEIEKHRIFDLCAFGINMVKDTVCIGLTMKSVDYFEAGLPLLNNVTSDTAWIVDKYGAGYNVGTNYAEIAKEIAKCDESKLLTMRYSARRAYEEVLSCEIYRERFESVFAELGLTDGEN